MVDHTEDTEEVLATDFQETYSEQAGLLPKWHCANNRIFWRLHLITLYSEL
jgi:hypothetical protein